ncbi:acyloxyacyl hydrolase [Noviherbaspirillum sp. ST9]|uniref:acyloxyacyl hydrolase n=1 Tax=Noviherbaspirillum sp. ST9 TaxID=3401606 RepID=UPI003B5864CD
MKEFRRHTVVLAIGCLLTALSPASFAADSFSVEYGTGDKTRMVRLGAQWKWDQMWWRSNGTHISGYWDLVVAQWRGKQFRNIPGNTQNITSLGITPVFRLQNDDLKGFYAEVGIGAHLLSELYDNNDKQLSTRYQFGDHLGIGYVFQNNADVGLKIQHFSNASIKKPNDGVNFALLRVSYPF